MDGRLPAGEHHHLRLALGGDERVEHGGALVEGDRVAVGPLARGLPESAKQIGQSRLQPVLTSMMPRQACCLCSGHSPQSEGQPSLTSVWVCSGRVPGLLNRWMSTYICGVAVDPGLELAVLGAAFAQEHLVVAGVDLGVDGALADRADRPGELEEHLVALAGCWPVSEIVMAPTLGRHDRGVRCARLHKLMPRIARRLPP